MTVLEATVQKYEKERQKRLRKDKLDQYVDFRDPKLAGMNIDPYADYDSINARDQPLKDGDGVTVLIIGAGMQGLITAYRLIKDSGMTTKDMILVDKAGNFGGTWYWNRYPGVACDIEGYCFLPLLEETGYMPRKRYPDGHEIRGQCERIAQQLDVQAQFCTLVKHQQWDDEAKRWVVKLTQDRGPNCEPRHVDLTVHAQFLVNASGLIPTPHIPKLNGVEIFQSTPGKKIMHTARWDWTSSGGSQENPEMSKFKGKRVGVVGTAATGIQVMPHVARHVEHLYVFQRTASHVGPQLQTATDPEEWKKITAKGGWQYERIASMDAVMAGEKDAVDIVQDSWTAIPAASAFSGNSNIIVAPGEEKETLQKLVKLDLPWSESMRARVESEVKNPETAEQLKAWFPGYCKRPTFSASYLSLFNQPHVTLVDTDGQGVEAYTKNGVMANGKEYELDVLVLATGYTTNFADSCPATLMNAPIIGRAGRSLKDKWDAEDFGTMFGVATNGFPNFFFCTFSGGAATLNLLSAFDNTTRMVARMIGEARSHAADPSKAEIEVNKDFEDSWTDKVAARARWFVASPSCTPSFLNGEGSLKMPGEQSKEEEEYGFRRAAWGQGMVNFRKVTNAWKDAPELEGVTLRG